jgi:hypothetical protein
MFTESKSSVFSKHLGDMSQSPLCLHHILKVTYLMVCIPTVGRNYLMAFRPTESRCLTTLRSLGPFNYNTSRGQQMDGLQLQVPPRRTR